MTNPSRDWTGFYDALSGRPPRPLFDRLMAHCELRPDQAVVAVDLGCGDGTETIELLRRGWSVVAVDAEPAAVERIRAAVPSGADDRIQAVVARLEEYQIPACDLVYAGVSLPFCAPQSFEQMWADLVSALRPGGCLAVHLFGHNDSWSSDPSMTFHSRSDVECLCAGLDIVELTETERDGPSFSGPKHWHTFEVIATRPSV